MKNIKSVGFTIVELLIVIVVIGILAAITVVAYGNIQSKAKFTRAQTDIASMKKAIEMHYAETGAYPISNGTGAWNFQSSAGMQLTFIPGVVPNYANTLPMVGDGSGATYIYRSNTTGTVYKLMKYRSGGIAASEWANVPADMIDGTGATNLDRYGVWSQGGQNL